MHDAGKFQVTPFVEMNIVRLNKLLSLVKIIVFLVADAMQPRSEFSGYQSFIYSTHIIFKHNKG